MKLKTLYLLFILTFISLWVCSQEGISKYSFPDILNYETLVCDFHMHTVFSDGLVWPKVRVNEAVNEGLDAIAISEHLEYMPYNSWLKGDHNTSYEIARPLAEKKGLILIRAAEITKSMPPGHFNFLFIENANAIDSIDWENAIAQAKEQGAFIMWNHPGWWQEDEIPIWYEEHSWLLLNGLMDGIEIVNENSYYPLAHQWAIDSGLTILGNSDIHDPVDYFFDKSKGEHRPVTLVFAKERSEEGIREALDNKRTAIYYKNSLIGNEKYLEALFLHSIDIIGDDSDTLLVNNYSVLDYHIMVQDSSHVDIIDYFVNSGEKNKKIFLPKGDSYWKILNCIVGKDDFLTIKFEEPKE